MKRMIVIALLAVMLLGCVSGVAEYQTLRPGARGEAVVQLQQALTAQGYALTADGVYGRATRAAVLNYQRAQGLRRDGIAGRQTQARLYAGQGTPAASTTPDAPDTQPATSAVPAQPATTNYGTVRPGARGQAVTALQQALIRHGYKLTADGIYGRATRQAVRAFQQKHKLKVDGIVGSKTWALLLADSTVPAETTPSQDAAPPTDTTPPAASADTAPLLPAVPGAEASVARTLSRGSESKQVRLLQAALGKAGVAALATDGDYGRKTVGAVRAFQGQYGLMQTGSADPTTLALVYAKSGTPSDALLATGINATARTATIRSGASSAASAVQNVPAGAAVTILRSQNGWYHVSYKQRSGYLPADSVRIIDRPAPLINLSRAYGEGAYALTGDKKADLLGVAFTQLGFAGGSSSVQVLSGTGPGGPYSKYGAAYNDPGESYCSYFVSWSARKAGIDASIINDARDVDGLFYDAQHAFVYFGTPTPTQVQAQKLSAACRVDRASYTPEAGDLIYLRWDGARATTTFSHIGIVYDVDANYVYTLEGAAAGHVDTRMYKLTDSDIVGYAKPKY